jgi:hypothetical protein
MLAAALATAPQARLTLQACRSADVAADVQGNQHQQEGFLKMAHRQIEFTVHGNNAQACTVTYSGKEVSLVPGAIAGDPIVRTIEEGFRETYPNGTEDTVSGVVTISATVA